jgi:hypothetical protein
VHDKCSSECGKLLKCKLVGFAKRAQSTIRYNAN